MKLTIQVTKKDISLGRRYSETKCPIALALKRKGAKHVSVSENKLCFSWKGKRYPVIWLPDTARSFVSEFDDRQPVKPIRFTVRD